MGLCVCCARRPAALREHTSTQPAVDVCEVAVCPPCCTRRLQLAMYRMGAERAPQVCCRCATAPQISAPLAGVRPEAATPGDLSRELGLLL